MALALALNGIKSITNIALLINSRSKLDCSP